MASGNVFRMNFALLLLFLPMSLFVIHTNGSREIPKELYAHLRNSTTLAELASKVGVKGLHIATNNHQGVVNSGMRLATAGRGATKFITQSNNRRYSQGSHHNINEDDRTRVIEYSPTDSRVVIIDDPIQSQDSCKIFQVCAPLELRKDPNVFYFPECIDMPQCLGGCCDNSHNCHPAEMQTVKVKVNAWKYEGVINGQQTFTPHQQLMVDMQKHIRCSCEICVEKPDCDEEHILMGCRCVCKNHHEANGCTGNRRYWSDETCSCACSRTWCPDGEVFSEQECKCEKITKFVTIHPTPDFSAVQKLYKGRTGRTSFQKRGIH